MSEKLAAVADPGLRAALRFARSSARPVTADELASATGVHRNVARSRLERLARAGLLEVGFERRSGREGPGGGRPAKTYSVAPELVAIEFPAHHYDDLLALLAEDRSAGSLRRVGVEFGRRLAALAKLRPARRTAVGMENLCEAVRALGYHATVLEVGDDSAVLETATCPLRPLVVRTPAAAAIDAGMWSGLAEAALAGTSAEAITCDTQGCLGEHEYCQVRFLLRREAS